MPMRRLKSAATKYLQAHPSFNHTAARLTTKKCSRTLRGSFLPFTSFQHRASLLSFDPDRFDRDHIGSFDFCPFGFAGKRQCPGSRYVLGILSFYVLSFALFSFSYVEMYCFMSVIMRKFRFELYDPEDKPKKVWGLLVHPDREIWIRLYRR